MRIGIDAGGTFTDFVVWRGDGSVETFKLRSNRRDPAAVILAGIAKATEGLKGRVKVEVIHGSTVATNALLERKGARTAFVTTAGFEDLLAIGRQNRQALYDLTPPPRRFLVPAELCFGVRERVHAGGAIAERPSDDELRALREQLAAAGVESVAVCLLHAYETPDNERVVGDALKGLGYLTLSSDVCPEFREYERASTAVVNAYVGPLMRRYLEALSARSPYPVLIMQSNGGLLTAAQAGTHAVRTVLSGPAGGVVGAFAVARESGYRKVLGFDMGGTSTDVSLADGKPRETVEAYVDGLPIRVPMLDIHTVGAGGGSIARIDAGGLLKVGPESAGSDPGPACYGTGEVPTVTDAHVVLGRIGADQLVGGAMHLDVARAEAALDRLGLGRVEAAAGVVRVANANMERAIRAVSIERGYDPREFALVAFGGCGGLHACEIAAELGIETVLAPANAGVLSAMGMLVAPRVRDYAAGVLGASAAKDRLEARFRQLETVARKENPKARLARFADMRYLGQSYELTVPWEKASGDAMLPVAAFHAEHQRTYGYSNLERGVEIVTIRVRATTDVRQQMKEGNRRMAGVSAGRDKSGRLEQRRVYVDGRFREIPVYRRSQLPRKVAAAGPALVIDYGSTTLVPSGWSLRADRSETLVLEAGGSKRRSR